MNVHRIKRSPFCLNCGDVLNPDKDNFCPHCGQLNNTRKETAFGLVRELVEDFLHLDSKVSTSILPLLLKPGKLTVDYNQGKRARYFHPVRLFLTVTIIMFLLNGLFNTEKESGSVSTLNIVTDPGKGAVDSILTANNADTSELHLGNLSYDFGDQIITNDTIRYLMKNGITDRKQLMDTLHIKKSFLNQFVMKQAMKGNAASWKELKEYYLHKIHWIVFALMPVFAFSMFLVYIRRNYYFAEHLIYAFHLHTAIFILLAIVTLINGITGWEIGIILWYIPVYYFLSLKNIYRQSWGKTFLKGSIVGMVYLFFGSIAFVGISVLLMVLY